MENGAAEPGDCSWYTAPELGLDAAVIPGDDVLCWPLIFGGGWGFCVSWMEMSLEISEVLRARWGEASSLAAGTGHCSRCTQKAGGDREPVEADISPLQHNAS